MIVDVTALGLLDSFASRNLRDIAHTIGLRGAFARVQPGFAFGKAPTAPDLEAGLEYLNRKFKRQGAGHV